MKDQPNQNILSSIQIAIPPFPLISRDKNPCINNASPTPNVCHHSLEQTIKKQSNFHTQRIAYTTKLPSKYLDQFMILKIQSIQNLINVGNSFLDRKFPILFNYLIMRNKIHKQKRLRRKQNQYPTNPQLESNPTCQNHIHKQIHIQQKYKQIKQNKEQHIIIQYTYQLLRSQTISQQVQQKLQKQLQSIKYMIEQIHCKIINVLNTQDLCINFNKVSYRLLEDIKQIVNNNQENKNRSNNKGKVKDRNNMENQNDIKNDKSSNQGQMQQAN